MTYLSGHHEVKFGGEFDNVNYSQINQYTGPRHGRAVVTVSRSAWGGPDVPGHVVVRVGPLVAPRGTPTSVTARMTRARRPAT